MSALNLIVSWLTIAFASLAGWLVIALPTAYIVFSIVFDVIVIRRWWLARCRRRLVERYRQNRATIVYLRALRSAVPADEIVPTLDIETFLQRIKDGE
jgi:hypothetical protein